MAIKKNAAKAKIGPKKQVKATFAECTAKDPLKCRYHGPKMLQAELDKLMGKGAAKVKKTKNGYEIDSDDAYDAYNKVAALLPNAKGSLGFKKAVFILGDGGFVTPEGEAELEDADTLSSTDAPEKKNEDPFSELDNIDTDIAENELDADLLDNFDELDDVVGEATEDLESELLGNTDFDDDVFADEPKEEQLPKDLTDEQIKDLVSFKGVKDEHFEQNPGLMESYKAIILHGLNPSWTPLNDNQKAWWNDLLDKTKSANPDELPALKVLKKTMAKVNGASENQKKLTKDDIIETFSPIFIGNLKEDTEFQHIYETVLTKHENPSGSPLTEGQLSWFKESSEKAHAAGVDNYALELLDKMLEEKGLIENKGNTLGGSEEKPTKDSLIAEMGKVIAKMKGEGLDLTWDAKKGNVLGKAFEDAINAEDIEGAAKALDNFKEYVEFLESGGDAPEEDDGLIKDEDVQEFYDAVGVGKIVTPEQIKASKELCNNGTWDGAPPTAANKKWFKENAKKFPDLKFSKAVLEALKPKKKGKNQKGGAKEALVSALSGNKESMVAEGMLKPLEHDESKFPQNVTQVELEKAIEHPIKELGGHGGLGTRLIQIGNKQYVCKAATGTGASVIRNGYNADMAYRAGGVYAPDSKLYTFGDGKVYKLAEFIKGKTLWDVWREADDPTRDKIRKDILKGYPLDVLFSNYDVLGTSPEVINNHEALVIPGPDGSPQKTHVAFDNIIIGDDGHAYRIDNDGSFAMKGNGDVKGANWKWADETDDDGKVVKGPDGKPKKIKVSAIFGKNAPVVHDFYDNWEDREWIDDFRTMRRNERCAGIFDRYSTADIFLSAGNINLDAVVGTLPQGIQKALAKPLFEMKQMTWRAVNMALGGYKNNGFVSMALDASYEASKRGLRELSAKSVSWNDSGFGEYKSHWGNYSPQPFGENPPEKPQDPTTALADKLKNEEYTGSKIGSIIFSAAKTINYHGGEKKFDEKGNPIGNPMSNPDYKPNAAKIAEWEKIDRDKLAELAKTDANAKILLGLYDTIAYSKENGWKKPIGLVPSGLTIQGKLAKDYLSPTEKKIHDDMAGAIAEYKAKMSVYQKELSEYEKRKDAHKKKEEEKAKAAGGSPYHNFHDFAKALMDEGIDTNGIAHRVQTNGIAPIESSMGAQKGSSYADSAVRWKVREMMALGFTPEQILEMADQKKLYKGSYYTSCINSHLLPHKEEWDRDMASQAMYLGMNMVKMENEHNDLYDKKSGVVFLNRNIGNIPQGLTAEEKKIYSTSSTTGWVGPHVDSAADCMQFEANWWHEPYKQVYAVPLSRIVCCANNKKATGDDYGYDSEQEYVGNLYNLPCWVYHDDQNLTWKGAIDEANKTSGMKGFLKKLASRLGFFSTHPKK